MSLVYDNRPVCGAYVVTRFYEGNEAEMVMCIRKGGPCPFRTRQPDGGHPRLRDGDTCAMFKDASAEGNVRGPNYIEE